MCEGPSSISGPIPPDPSLFPQYYKRPASARGRIEGNQDGTLALLSGPLAPDPVLHPGCYSARVPAPRPRISPNATHILERGRKGIVGDLLKLEGLSITPVPRQSKNYRVHDFGKENVRRLREIQKRCKEQEAKRAQSHPEPVKALWTSSKYQNVPSRVMAQLQARSRKNVSEFCVFPHQELINLFIPCRFVVQVLGHIQGQAIDFIKHNARAAGKTVFRRSQSLTNLKDMPVPSAVIGQVPHYLEERKEQWRKEAEERRKNRPDPTIPPGHTLMPESERQGTLKTLNEAHRSLVTELLSLPLKADNLSVRSRRAHLDCRLSEIEEAIKIFSRDKVYIKIDS
uniref:Enkurin domain-containing protein n=1 Tax=Salarias fasciatus TaxID=181472 RepID=A0A672JAX4_SALFA